MLNQIAAALKLSLKECNKIEDPKEYVSEIVATLTRYKTNIFKMICDSGSKLHHDPKELIQFRIGTSFRSTCGFDRVPRLQSRDISILYISALIPNEAGVMNREKVKSVSIDVSDIIDQEKLLGLVPNCHRPVAEVAEAGEQDRVEIPDLYFSMERGPDEINSFIIQFNANVYRSAELESYLQKVVDIPSDPRKTLNQLNGKPQQMYGDEYLPKSALDSKPETIRDKQLRVLRERIGTSTPGSKTIKAKRKVRGQPPRQPVAKAN